MINDINFNLNIINNNLNNIINCMNNINNTLLRQQDNNYTPINFIKNIMNQNIQIANQISSNNNIINLTINNPLFFQNNNNIIEQNNQIHHMLPRKEEVKNIHYAHLFPESKNLRMVISFINSGDSSGSKFVITTPNDIKVKDLLFFFAKEKGINPNILGKDIYFIFNGLKININEDKDLTSFGFRNWSSIITVDLKNIIGGNSNC